MFQEMKLVCSGIRQLGGRGSAQIAGVWWQQQLLLPTGPPNTLDCTKFGTVSQSNDDVLPTTDHISAGCSPESCSSFPGLQHNPIWYQADNTQWTSDTWLRNSLVAVPLLLHKYPRYCRTGSLHFHKRSQHIWASVHERQQQQPDKQAAAAATAAKGMAASSSVAASKHRCAAAAGDLLYSQQGSSSSGSSDEDEPQLLRWPTAHKMTISQQTQPAVAHSPDVTCTTGSSSASSRRQRLLQRQRPDRPGVSFDASSGGNTSSRQKHSKQQQRAQQQAWQRQGAARPTDMRTPAAWYPAARAMTRQLVAHVGPTNSGKTHVALAALSAAPSGVYCGPLRLLACEVADRLNAAGVPCNLVTGQEVCVVPGARHTACTVEMADLDHNTEVAVLDEVQMLADRARGWSWTRVLLGLPAQQIHVCGDPAATSLIQQLAAHCDDPLVINRYKRLSPLVVEAQALPGLDAVQEGDCVVAFGRKALHKLRKNILKAWDRRQQQQQQHGVGMVYGALPPEARRTQAALFNAGPDTGPRYSVLVASDAVGMGLNLNIRRVIFASMHKFDGQELRRLTPSEVKQIAGRAGRFGGAHAAGFVTCMKESELPLLRQCLATASDEIQDACLLPRFEQLEQYARLQARSLPFYKLLAKFADAATLSGPYFLADMSNMVALGRVLRHLEPEGLDLEDMFLWCTAPASADDPAVLQALLTFAELYVCDRQVTPDCMAPPVAAAPATPAEMKAAEELFRVYDLYLWLAGRVGHGVFRGRRLVQQQRACVAAQIDQGLRKMGGVIGSPADDDGLGGAAAAAAAAELVDECLAAERANALYSVDEEGAEVA